MKTLIIFLAITGIVAYGIITLLALLTWIARNTEDFEDVQIPETFRLPEIIHELDQKEKAATRESE